MKIFLHGIGYVFLLFLVTFTWDLGSSSKLFPNSYSQIVFCVVMGFSASILINHIEKNEEKEKEKHKKN